MVIRPMNGKDKNAIMRILKNTPEFMPAEVVLADEVIDSYLFNPAESGYFILVSEVDSKVAGYVCYGPTPITEDTWDLYWIAVDHEIQGQGIGRRLMGAAENEIKRQKGRLILLETSSKPGYEKTNLFYLHLDYKETARIKDFYMIGDDQVIYEKRF
ncbi:MAG TPA: GNAT family N-acetyltransferase [Dehalococcoidales bacterium]